MKNTRVKIVCSVNGEYEISFYTPYLEKDDAVRFDANFSDWSDFIEECFRPKVIYHGSKCSHDIMFYSEIETLPDFEEAMPL